MSASLIILKIITISLALGLVVAQAPAGSFHRKPGRVTNTQNRKTTSTETPDRIANDDDNSSDQCPEPNGYFADAEQCDKYYACNEGKITEKLCPDGMVFNDYSIDQEKCDLPYNIDCTKRPKLQQPIPSQNCPRQNGYFGHSDANNCDTFYYCVSGMFNMIKCPDGLVFNPKTGICTWPDEAQKVGCTSADVFQFTCPKVNESVAVTHPRYTDPEDCQFFYVCINGDTPRRNGCKLGQAFDESSKRCDWARKIPECAEWYKGQLTDAQLDELENPKPPAKTRVKGPSRRKSPKKPPQKVVEVEDEEEEYEE